MEPEKAKIKPEKTEIEPEKAKREVTSGEAAEFVKAPLSEELCIGK